MYSPRDLATWDGDYPMLVVTAPQEDGQGLGRIGAPQFNVTTTLRVLGRVQRAAEEDDLAAAKLYEDLEALRDQVKRAIINHPTIMGLLQQYPFFRSAIDEAAREDSGLHQGQVVVDIGMEFFQGPDEFYQEPYRAVGGPGAGPHARGTEFPAQQSIFPSREDIMFIKPAPGMLIRHPVTRDLLPESGMDVDDNDRYFLRRLRDGDVVQVATAVKAGRPSRSALPDIEGAHSGNLV